MARALRLAYAGAFYHVTCRGNARQPIFRDDHDRQAFVSNSPSRHLPRLGSEEAYPEQVALYVKFKSDQGELFWNDLIKRAGLADRRKDNVVPIAERRRRTGSRG